MTKIITSVSNPAIKNIAALRNSAKRKKVGLSIAEGQREVGKLLDSNLIVEGIYFPKNNKSSFKQLLEKAKERCIKQFALDERVYSKIAFGVREEVIAVFKPVNSKISEFSKRKKAFYVIVEKVEKPGNLGAILRTCDGAGVDGIIICDGRTDIYNPNVIRASLGTVFSQKIVNCSNEQVLQFLKEQKVKVIAASPKARIKYTEANLDQACAIIVGSEQEGLSPFWMKEADILINIPMKGAADSLNVSVSTAIILYEALRQQTK